MNLFSLPLSSEQRPLICYQGSFDPPHQGHVSALESAMAKTHAIGAVVIACCGENHEKPDRSPLEIRRAMCVVCFRHLDNVTVSELSDQETKALLLKDGYIITVIGSDAWPKYSQRPRIPFHAICIVLRDAEETSEYPLEIQGKKIVCVTPGVQGLSSSDIRGAFRLHSEVYESSALLPEYFLSSLKLETLEYIIQTRLYYQSRQDRVMEVQREINEYVNNQVFTNRSFHLRCLTGNSPSPSDLRGKSGDLTFLASADDGQKIFIKAYVTSTHKRDFQQEIGGIESLRAFSSEALRGPDLIYWKESCASYSHIGVPFFNEPDVATIFQLPICQEMIEQFYQACFCVGKVLSELHHRQIVPIQNEVLRKRTEVLNLRTKNRLERLPEEKKLTYSSTFNSSYRSFVENPGPQTYIHGDASLSNFLVDVEKELVRMIDLAPFFLAQTEEGGPCGLPAEDYYRFLGDLFWLNANHSLPYETMVLAQQSFKRGYLTFPSLITEEAHEYFTNYWRIRNRKIYSIDLPFHLSSIY